MSQPRFVSDAQSKEEIVPLMMDASSDAVQNPNRLFNSKKYSCHETVLNKYIHAVNFCCDRDLKNATNAGEFVSENLTLAYRADSRAHTKIFMEGFSAYDIRRTCVYPGCLCGTCDKEFITTLALVVACSPLLVVGLPCAIMMAADSCTRQHALYSAPYASNWSALSFAKEINEAKAWYAPRNDSGEQWIYFTLLEGFVDFSHFSQHQINAGNEKSPERQDIDDPSGIYDAKEIFPRNLKNQTVPANQVIAALKCDGFDRRHLNAAPEIVFNKCSVIWEKIAEAVKATGADITATSPTVKITINKLEAIIKTAIVELEDLKKSGPRVMAMMK